MFVLKSKYNKLLIVFKALEKDWDTIFEDLQECKEELSILRADSLALTAMRQRRESIKHKHQAEIGTLWKEIARLRERVGATAKNHDEIMNYLPIHWRNYLEYKAGWWGLGEFGELLGLNGCRGNKKKILGRIRGLNRALVNDERFLDKEKDVNPE